MKTFIARCVYDGIQVCFQFDFIHQSQKSIHWFASGKVDKTLLPHMQKSGEALAAGRKSIWKRIENKQWTCCSSFMSKTWFYFLIPFSCFLVCFLIRNFNSFCSYFYYCNWPENFHHHAYSRHYANKEWIIFSTTTLIPGNTSIRERRVFVVSKFLHLYITNK